ncbi:MAG TPA: hypothetical protein VGT41_03120 [Candidatus Babeliales bacterium]|nr:hypothetical protein [Candidatus Babeliales bacterium]
MKNCSFKIIFGIGILMVVSPFAIQSAASLHDSPEDLARQERAARQAKEDAKRVEEARTLRMLEGQPEDLQAVREKRRQRMGPAMEAQSRRLAEAAQRQRESALAQNSSEQLQAASATPEEAFFYDEKTPQETEGAIAEEGTARAIEASLQSSQSRTMSTSEEDEKEREETTVADRPARRLVIPTDVSPAQGIEFLAMPGVGEIMGEYLEAKPKITDSTAVIDSTVFADQLGYLQAVALSPDNQSIVTVSGGRARMWDVKNRTEIREFTGFKPYYGPRSVAISPDGQYVVMGSAGGEIGIWDMSSGEAIRVFEAQTDEIDSIAISSDNRFIVTASSNVTGCRDKTISVWDLQGALIRTIPVSHQANSVAISSDNQLIITASSEGTYIWNANNGELIRKINGGTGHIALSLDNQFIITTVGEKALLWNMRDLTLLREIAGHNHMDMISSVAISSDNQLVVTGSFHGAVLVWNLESGALIHTLQDMAYTSINSIRSIVISSDNQFIVVGYFDGIVRIFRLRAPESLATQARLYPQHLLETSLARAQKLLSSAKQNVYFPEASIQRIAEYVYELQNINPSAGAVVVRIQAIIDKINEEFKRGKEMADEEAMHRAHGMGSMY